MSRLSDDEILARLAQSKAILDLKVTSPRRILAVAMPECYRRAVEAIHGIGISHVVSLTAIDTESGFELQLQLGRGTIVSLKVILPAESPELATVADLLPGASVHEREVHDILGINFKNSPDQSRLILPDDWPAGVYPLRKSFTPTVPLPAKEVKQ